MVTVGMNYKVLPGKETVFENAFSRVVDAMASMPGHTQTKLFKEVASTGTYLILSEWSDENAFNAFVRSESFAKVTNWGKEQILEGRPSHTIFAPQP